MCAPCDAHHVYLVMSPTFGLLEECSEEVARGRQGRFASEKHYYSVSPVGSCFGDCCLTVMLHMRGARKARVNNDNKGTHQAGYLLKEGHGQSKQARVPAQQEQQQASSNSPPNGCAWKRRRDRRLLVIFKLPTPVSPRRTARGDVNISTFSLALTPKADE